MGQSLDIGKEFILKSRRYSPFVGRYWWRGNSSLRNEMFGHEKRRFWGACHNSPHMLKVLTWKRIRFIYVSPERRARING